MWHDFAITKIILKEHTTIRYMLLNPSERASTNAGTLWTGTNFVRQNWSYWRHCPRDNYDHHIIVWADQLSSHLSDLSVQSIPNSKTAHRATTMAKPKQVEDTVLPCHDASEVQIY